jgi:hypothetical protein
MGWTITDGFDDSLLAERLNVEQAYTRRTTGKKKARMANHAGFLKFWSG